MKKYELKVKIKSLDLERKLIEQDAVRLDGRAARATQRGKSVAAERLRRHAASLREHERGLAVEVRATLIAMGHLRRLPYARVEGSAWVRPPLERARKIAESFGSSRYTDAGWELWCAEATSHWEVARSALEAKSRRKVLVRTGTPAEGSTQDAATAR